MFKERLSQSALIAKMRTVSDKDVRAVHDWLLTKEMQFNLCTDEEIELTDAQVLLQCKMYIAAARIANGFGCDTIGIQYQLRGSHEACPSGIT